VPYRHTIPLWELETDYYLHNFHVSAGRGTMYSMKTYERAFGVDGLDDAEAAFAVARSARALSRYGLARPLSNSRSLTQEILHQSEKESSRVARVRRRCNAQHEALSKWWKIALQANFQQRIWMHLKESIPDSLLPSKYERLYQPDKIAQFDRFFARAWATPVRRSHSAQHADGAGVDGDTQDLMRYVSQCHGCDIIDESKVDLPKRSQEVDISLQQYVSSHGYEPGFESSLAAYAKYYRNSYGERDITRIHSASDEVSTSTKDLYLQYVSPSSTAFSGPRSNRTEVIDEFQACLRDYALRSDDVTGIRQVRTIHSFLMKAAVSQAYS
jgi:hypothetical protein